MQISVDRALLLSEQGQDLSNRDPIPINPIVEVFKAMAEDHFTEILGRILWKLGKESAHLNIDDVKAYTTSCGETYKGLMVALNGESPTLDKCNFDSTQVNFDCLQDQIIQHGKQLKKEPEGSFFSYGFMLAHAPMYSDAAYEEYSTDFRGHVFVVLQYRDSSNKIKFRVFQSYLHTYTLKDCISNHSKDFTKNEFLCFLGELKDFVSMSKWTNREEVFHQKYFHAPGGNEVIGMNFPIGIPLRVEWQKNSCEKVKQLQAEFTALKTSDIFPKITFYKKQGSRCFPCDGKGL